VFSTPSPESGDVMIANLFARFARPEGARTIPEPSGFYLSLAGLIGLFLGVTGKGRRRTKVPR
jgi:hypothetical protein